ncbi:MAG: FliM/FliN family flagellar motor switch protein, partial [Candidatus Poribacteria bacterium]|nr:FliM/FliN family flagellar motor switch protein [Candidatus Poribacteria bacterium]
AMFASTGLTINKDLRDSLEKVKVPIYGILVRDRLRMQDMLEMEVEDVLTFRTNLNEASEIVIGKNRVFWARPGALGRRHAIRVEAFIEPEQTSPVELTSDSIAESDDASQPEDEVTEENDSKGHFEVRR